MTKKLVSIRIMLKEFESNLNNFFGFSVNDLLNCHETAMLSCQKSHVFTCA